MKLDVRGRGKFKPAPDLTPEIVREVLMEKIREEMEVVIEDNFDPQYDPIANREDKFKVVSLFSGCGGLDLGFELAGLQAVVGEQDAMAAYHGDRAQFDEARHHSVFHTVYTNDLFPEANQTYAMNFPPVWQHQMDIRQVFRFPQADLVLGGFPCPGFSEAGPRLIDDQRNFLYLHFIRCLIQTQPKFFVAENVKGMLTLGKGEVLNQIRQDFTAAGYNVEVALLNAMDYGVPQARERVFLVGVRKDLDFHYEFPQPTHGPYGMNPYVTLKDAIWDLRYEPGPYFEGSFSSIYLSRNRKKSWDEISFTIQASGRHAPLHPNGPAMVKLGKDQWVLPAPAEVHRRLSVREIARIQTFPDWFDFSYGLNRNMSMNGQLNKVYKQIGNAVPVMLAKAVAQPIADWVRAHLENQYHEQQNETRNAEMLQVAATSE